jgi:hypothetical protein
MPLPCKNHAIPGANAQQQQFLRPTTKHHGGKRGGLIIHSSLDARQVPDLQTIPRAAFKCSKSRKVQRQNVCVMTLLEVDTHRHQGHDQP